MILIADSGSTKADWVLIDNNRVISKISTVGFNPNYWKSDEITRELEANFDRRVVQTEAVTDVMFYGSGVWNERLKLIVCKGLQSFFHNAKIEVEHDLLGAARAVNQNNPGICCILGTGSNSCLYDGKNVIDNINNLGYLVGDEGSGSDMGKALIRSYAYREMPTDLELAFEKNYPQGIAGILSRIYNEPHSNVYLAQFTKFLNLNINHPHIKDLVSKSLDDFIRRNVLKYDQFHHIPINFVGSIAYFFNIYLQRALESHNLKMGKVIKAPIDGLVDYHLSANSQKL